MASPGVLLLQPVLKSGQRGRCAVFEKFPRIVQHIHEPALGQDFGIVEENIQKIQALEQEPEFDRETLSKLMFAKDNVLHALKLRATIPSDAIVASNSLQSNFKVANGFLIVDGKLVCKSSRGINQREFRPLDGDYNVFVLDQERLGLRTVSIREGLIDLQGPSIRNAISGPALIRDGVFVPPQQKRLAWHAEHDQVNWDYNTTRAAWSSIGVDKQGRLVLLHVIGQGVDAPLLSEYAAIAIEQFGMQQALLMGGSADVQQFVRGDVEEFLTATSRVGSATKDDAATGGERDLAAMLFFFPN